MSLAEHLERHRTRLDTLIGLLDEERRLLGDGAVDGDGLARVAQAKQEQQPRDGGRLKQLESQLRVLKGKLASQKKLLAVRERHEQTVANLRSDIDSMKRAKVAMERSHPSRSQPPFPLLSRSRQAS